MNWKERLRQAGIPAALGAALLFGAGTPLAKWLLDAVDPWLLAGLLYPEIDIKNDDLGACGCQTLDQPGVGRAWPVRYRPVKAELRSAGVTDGDHDDVLRRRLWTAQIARVLPSPPPSPLRASARTGSRRAHHICTRTGQSMPEAARSQSQHVTCCGVRGRTARQTHRGCFSRPRREGAAAPVGW